MKRVIIDLEIPDYNLLLFALGCAVGTTHKDDTLRKNLQRLADVVARNATMREIS